MKLYAFFIVVMAIFLVVETTLLSFPFVLFWSIVFFLVRRKILILCCSVFFAIVLDYLWVSPVGITPLYMLILFLFVVIQQSFFEAADYKIILGMVLTSAFAYSIIVAYGITLLFFAACIINSILAIPFLKTRDQVVNSSYRVW